MASSAALDPPHARLRVSKARHAFGPRTVLDGVDMEIKAGEIYGLIGPNGAGKTTLMKAICGRLVPDGGRVRLDGKDPGADAAMRRRIGFVPQDIAIFPHLTVRENLHVLGRLAGVRRRDIKAAVRSAIEQAGLVERANQLARTLSGGYQRRVNICASTLHDPLLLVLDEPTVGIDIDAREAIHAMLARMRDRGTAILLTTHDLEQAQAVCDRVGVLAAGRMVADGAPARLLADAFGADKELIATLKAAPDAAARDCLRACGLNATHVATTWVGRRSIHQLDAAALGKNLTDAGMSVGEIRIREPDLASLFVRLIGPGGKP